MSTSLLAAKHNTPYENILEHGNENCASFTPQKHALFFFSLDGGPVPWKTTAFLILCVSDEVEMNATVT